MKSKESLKKIFIASITTFFLTACFHSNATDSSDTKTGFHSYATENFKMQIPSSWEVLTKQHFTSAIPASTVLALRSNIKNPLFTPNIVVLKNELSSEISTLDYAKLLRSSVTQDLGNFREIAIEEEKIKIAGKEEKSLFIYVEGKDQPASDLKHFIQRVAVKDKKAYIITGAFLADADKTISEKIEKIVRSFEVK